MRVIVGCEFSAIVREAFKARGHYAISCDLLPSEIPGEHYQGDIRDIMNEGFDLGIFFPPCTYITTSANKWLKDQPARKSGVLVGAERRKAQQEALDFVRCLMSAEIPQIAIENPIGVISTAIGKPDQIIQPWMFGHPEQKATCLWLKDLPLLIPTNIVEGREQKIWTMKRSNKNRAYDRSRTYQGIANAMANRWG